ncbi:MAG TPA: hypothetical protein VGG74_03750 [Kofleriaceae bacterium]|jgi:hypothetical protein
MKVASITFEHLLFASAVALTGCASSPGSNDELGATLANAPAATPAAKTFASLTNAPSFTPSLVQVLTDGRVIAQDYLTNNWWALTPDNTGSYIDGTWSALASGPSGYEPLFYASAVLPDGRFFTGGGEYNAADTSAPNDGNDWGKLAAIYDPVANKWTSVTMPAAWTMMGDAQSVVFPDGRYMVADCCEDHAAILNPANLTWDSDSTIGANKGDSNYDEEGWTLLPNGKVLSVDAIDVTANVQESEMLDPATIAWTNAGTVGVQLADNDAARNPDGDFASEELGPQVLRPDGTVISFGALGPNAVYNTNTQAWSTAPSFPNGLDCADAAASLLPNGNVLVVTTAGVYGMSDSVFFEWDGTKLNQLAGPSDAANNGSYQYTMVVLPTGEVLVSTQTSLQVYEPTAPTNTSAYEPVITSVPVLEDTSGFSGAELAQIRANEAAPLPVGVEGQLDLLPLMDIYTGRTYSVSGTRLNGISQGAAYGDDAQTATNFPLVRFTNQTTNHVQYGRTHDGSNYAIALTTTGSTHLDVPTTIEKGLSNMQVVANGIASPAILVNVK